MAGLFITFEGGEGVGKSTQVSLLEQALKNSGHGVVVTREPGGTPTAEDIRNVLFNPKHDKAWTPQAEALMMYAARALHINDVITPALSAGKVVICDRYIDSTRVYQQECKSLVDVLEGQIAKDTMPDVTFILDLDAEAAMARVGSRGAENRNDEKSVEFYKDLRQGFLEIAKNNPKRCEVINAMQSIEDIAKQVLNVTNERLSA
jgi:dTMP kinase